MDRHDSTKPQNILSKIPEVLLLLNSIIENVSISDCSVNVAETEIKNIPRMKLWFFFCNSDHFSI